MNVPNTEKIEIDLLLEGILRRYGYDFRNYAKASLKRRLQNRLNLAELNHFSELLPRVLHDEGFFDQVLADLSITVTEFFRDPHFYLALRKQVIPILKTYSFVKIWHAGCATAEEVYSMAMVLHEEGFLDRAQIYATDFNNRSLQIAQEGIYPVDQFKQYTDNYNRSGGQASFSDYFLVRYQSAKIHSYLKDKITFANHNLVTDSVFGEMNLIICRNVLIYFDQTLQNRVLTLFADSLCHRGLLCLGTKESMTGLEVNDWFETIAAREKIFRKKTLSSYAPFGVFE